MIGERGSWILSIAISIMVILGTGTFSFSSEYFYIQRPQLGFELLFRLDHEDRENPDISTENERYTYFERLNLHTRGWIYHPAFLEYELTLSPEWEQDIEKSDGDKRKSKSYLQGYTAEFTFLKYKPYSLTLFGNRSTAFSTGPMAQKTKTEYQNLGAALQLRLKSFSSSIEYNSSEIEKSGRYESISEKEEIYIRSRHFSKYGNTHLRALYSDLKDRSETSSVDTLTKELGLFNIYFFPGGKASLRSGLTLRDKSSEYFFERGYSLNEGLSIQHKRNLFTNYIFNVDSYDQSEQRRENIRGSFNLIHLLYENLTTSLSLNALKSHSQGGQERIYSGGLHWRYIRNIPDGVINASIFHDYSIVDKAPNMKMNRSYVTGEIITVTDVEPAFLSNENIDISTIQVYNEARTKLYIKDRDYRIEEIGSFVRIACVIGGRIDVDQDCSDGATLSVDYEFIPYPSFDYLQRNKFYGISISLWNTFRVYFNFSRSKQRFLKGMKPHRLSASEIQTIGTSIAYKWSRTSAYYKDESSTSRSIEAWRLTEALVLKPTQKSSLTGSASFGVTRFKEIISGNDKDRFKTYRIRYQLSLPREGIFGIEGHYTSVKGITSDIQTTGVLSDFYIRYNIYTLMINYGFSYQRDKTVDETLKNHQFMVRIKRELF